VLTKALDQSREQSVQQGMLAGWARAVLEVLEVRGLNVSPGQRASILNCGDLETLTRWHHQAITAISIDELLR
jgi:hypothetical protein